MEKHEFEEDVNYLQYEYDKFKKRIKKITTGEFKKSLKKIDEENLKEVIKEAGNNMYKNKLLKRKSIYNFIIFSLERILWEKNKQIKGHTERLKRFAVQLGRAINLPQNKLDELVLLPNLHDIGKIAIPDKILMKKGKLTAKEWKIIKKHPEIGYKIAESTPQIASIAEDILSHHEWWNGTGYPQGLMGEDIPINVCITSIVDAYDVMTFGRPYREAISEEEAIEELGRCSGTQFNPMLVQKFVILLKKLN
ncbi:MAG: HD domain-containing protein [Actinobacteria bacterium]|nr:HD domain-containing protein [Actinomycetota bacterium]